MQTQLSPEHRDTAYGREADEILRACVHCGFCTATCPTYQLLGDERDGPRGRIYLIKQVLEGATATSRTQLHLDRCLTCRACETTCPSGVRYGRLVDIGREVVAQQVKRPFGERLKRFLLRALVPYPSRFGPLLRMGQAMRGWLPSALRHHIPARQSPTAPSTARHARRMLILDGCVQRVATPNTNAAASRVLDRLGIELVRTPEAGCCGAVSHHLSAPAEALDFVRRNIDVWWPQVEAGAEAIIVSASGCGTMVKEYGDLLRDDPVYAERAQRISTLTRDLSEVIQPEPLPLEPLTPEPLSTNPATLPPLKVAFQSPCSLQHGQQLHGVVEGILTRAGCSLTHVPDAHLCCGSAGTYSVLQPDLSSQLLAGKVAALEGDAPDVIATANVGCQLHLQSATEIPLRHWIEVLDDRLEACAAPIDGVVDGPSGSGGATPR